MQKNGLSWIGALLLTFVTFSSLGQETASISGLVLDGQSKQALPFATIIIKQKADSTLVSGTVSDVEGRFSIVGIPNGNYQVVISFVGYKNYRQPLLVGPLNKIFDFGKVQLMPDATSLNSVEVSVSREQVASTLEKKTFVLNENISQSGGSVLDAMRNLPGVTVSDGKIMLRGSDQVSVLIDGRQSSLTGFGNQKGLDNIPASNIERIEIINNPSAKYNANGMAGIVNIIYKKENQQGLNGEWGVATGIGELWQRRANLSSISPKYGQTPKLNPNISLNYRTKKANWFFQGDGILRRRVNANEFTLRDYTDGTTDVASQFLENRTQKLYNIKGGLDWFLNEQNTITLFTLWQDEYHIDRGDVPYENAETSKRLRLWGWREDEHTRFINYAANWHHKFKQVGHEIKLGYMYTGGGEDESFPFTDSSQVRQSTDATFLTVFEYVHAFNLDYVKPLRTGRLEFGSRVTLRHIPITYTLTPGQNSILDPQLGRWSKYNENVYASYINYVRESEKVDLEAGFRFEPSVVNYQLDPANIYYQNNSYRYFPLFPNVRLTIKMNEQNTVSIFHNRRVDRPVEFDVRPFPKYDDPELLKTGNPNLRPQFTSTWEVAYKNYWGNGSVFLSAYYKQIDKIISRIYTTDNLSGYNIVNTIPANLGQATNAGLEVAYQQTFSAKLKLSASLTGYQNHINAFRGKSFYPYEQGFSAVASTITTGNFKVIGNLKFGKQIDFQLSSVYYARDIIPQGKIKSRYSLDFGLKKATKNNKVEFRLMGTDLLNTFQIRKDFKSSTVNIKAYNYYETQVITLGAKFKI